MRLLLVVLLAGVAVSVGDAAGPVTFTDITARAGITFLHNNGATGKKYFPETMGGGVAVLDADGDGWQDLFFVNGTAFPGEAGGATTSGLYRNNHDGTFADITAGSGLDVPLYGMGATAGDFDNDGNIDLFVTAWGGGRLFRNLGRGRFADVTTPAGVADNGWSSSALFVDYDKDGRLDLLVGRYVQWLPQLPVVCTLPGKGRVYCTPDRFPGSFPLLYHNKGDGTFENVTTAARLVPLNNATLGVATLDFDADGWPDLFIANDMRPNRLYRNQHDGTFADVGLKAGVAMLGNGLARAGMGVDAADYDGSGLPSLIVGNFSNEMMAVYHNEGGGLFLDDAPGGAIGRDSRQSLTFGLFFFDYDLDGRLDIFGANGHISDAFPAQMSQMKYAQRPHLFRNLGQRRFEEAVTQVGPDLAREIVGRGAAYVDLDNDGDLDLVVVENHGPARLYRNDGGNTNRSIRVTLAGTSSNRDGIGARIDVMRSADGPAWTVVKSGSSYASQSELPVTFGLGPAGRVTGLKVTWPRGKVDTLGAVESGQMITIREGAGVVARAPLAGRTAVGGRGRR